MAFIAGYNAAVYISSNASSLALPSNDVLTDSGDQTTYFEATAAHRYWDDSAAPTVQTSPDGVTWTTQSATLYTVQYVGGKIIFNSAQAAGTQCRISTGGKYFAYTTFAQGTSWELDGSADMVETSVFGGGRGKKYLPTLFTGKFSLKTFYIDQTFFTNITTGFRFIFSGSVDGTKRYESYSYLTADKISVPVGGVVGEDVEFQVTGAWYYN